MRILRHAGRAPVPDAARRAVLALGNFDAVHRGHRAVLAEARGISERAGNPLAALTFEPHPRRLFNPGLPPLRLVSFADKARLLAAQGVEWLHVAHFTPAFARTGAEEFISGILHERLQAAHIVTGENFLFGHKRGGDSALLRARCAALGMGYSAVAAAGGEDGAHYSSSAARAALAAGDLARAAAILGRPHRIRRRVVHGDGRGAGLGYPTANLPLGNLFCPRHGVYAVRVYREMEPRRPLPGVASLGLRPMFRVEAPLLEVHLFDFGEPLYGERLEVELTVWLREEKIFPSQAALQDAMREDARQARELFEIGDAPCPRS